MKAADLPLDYNAVDILERNLAARADKYAVVRTLSHRDNNHLMSSHSGT